MGFIVVAYHRSTYMYNQQHQQLPLSYDTLQFSGKSQCASDTPLYRTNLRQPSLLQLVVIAKFPVKQSNCETDHQPFSPLFSPPTVTHYKHTLLRLN